MFTPHLSIKVWREHVLKTVRERYVLDKVLTKGILNEMHGFGYFLHKVLLWCALGADVVEDEELLHGDDAVHVGVVHPEQVILHLLRVDLGQCYLYKLLEVFS